MKDKSLAVELHLSVFNHSLYVKIDSLEADMSCSSMFIDYALGSNTIQSESFRRLGERPARHGVRI
jgi:hypothetical protein